MSFFGEQVSDRISLVHPRLDEKPWGGQSLRSFGMDIPDDRPIGEALITANDARVSAGLGEGRKLGDIVADNPAARLGQRAVDIVGGRALFPLLVKLIDANQDLSIQVHPNDQQAMPLHQPGKTEAWYVLSARPDSRLYLGLTNPDDLDRFAAAADRQDGSSAHHLRAINAVAGQTYLLPAGTVHALGAGVIVYEIQQPSDITYRLDDWGRVDAAGRPREMHRDAGMAVVRPELQPNAIEPVRIDRHDQHRSILVACKYFALEHWVWDLESAALLPESTGPQVLTVLSGNAVLGGFHVQSGESVVVWPGDHEVLLSSNQAVLLRGWIPDATDVASSGEGR